MTTWRRRVLALHLHSLSCAALLLSEVPTRRKKWWVHPLWRSRDLYGSYHSLVKSLKNDDPIYFKKYLRMTPEEFRLLKSKVKPFLKKKPAGRRALSVGHRLALTLRFLASGDSMASTAFSFRVGFSTVCAVVAEVCDALWKALVDEYLRSPTTNDWESIATDFAARWQFPNCVGVADGKHVQVQAPSKSGSTFYNYKGHFSIVLMALVDSNYKFIMVDVGGHGSNSDGGVWKNSKFGSAFDAGRVNVPPPRVLPNSDLVVPHVILGDEAFQLRNNFMRPFPGKQLDEPRRIYNYRLSRARRCVENAFGILAARWRIFRRPINLKPHNVDRVVKACIILHNFLKTEAEKSGNSAYCPPGFEDRVDNGILIEGDWRREVLLSQTAFSDAGSSAIRNYSNAAFEVREMFVEYFNSNGSVPWQAEATGINENYIT